MSSMGRVGEDFKVIIEEDSIEGTEPDLVGLVVGSMEGIEVALMHVIEEVSTVVVVGVMMAEVGEDLMEGIGEDLMETIVLVSMEGIAADLMEGIVESLEEIGVDLTVIEEGFKEDVEHLGGEEVVLEAMGKLKEALERVAGLEDVEEDLAQMVPSSEGQILIEVVGHLQEEVISIAVEAKGILEAGEDLEAEVEHLVLTCLLRGSAGEEELNIRGGEALS